VLVMRRLLIPLLALIAVPTATAAFTVTLNTTSPQTFTAITLNGVDQTQTLPLSITVVNTGGTNGTGWSVTAAAGAPTSGANTLSPLQVTAVSAAACTIGQREDLQRGRRHRHGLGRPDGDPSDDLRRQGASRNLFGVADGCRHHQPVASAACAASQASYSSPSS
jgi:hypothetical protein